MSRFELAGVRTSGIRAIIRRKSAVETGYVRHSSRPERKHTSNAAVKERHGGHYAYRPRRPCPVFFSGSSWTRNARKTRTNRRKWSFQSPYWRVTVQAWIRLRVCGRASRRYDHGSEFVLGFQDDIIARILALEPVIADVRFVSTC